MCMSPPQQCCGEPREGEDMYVECMVTEDKGVAIDGCRSSVAANPEVLGFNSRQHHLSIFPFAVFNSKVFGQ